MKKIFSRLTAAVLAAGMLGTAAFTSAPPADIANAAEKIRIMPLGDSITDGFSSDGGYRKYLDCILKQKGLTNYDFVGPQGTDSASFTYNGQQVTYDNNHAGWSGYTIVDMPGGWFGQLNGIYETLKNGSYMSKYKPDVILLQIGTNDISQGKLNVSEEHLHTLLDYLFSNMSAEGMIFMTTIPDLGNTFGGSTQSDIDAYNKIVNKVGNEYIAKGKNLKLADIHSVIDASRDLADGVHPNETGYEKMGSYWADILEDYLKTPASAGSSSGSAGGTQPSAARPTNAAITRGDLNRDGYIDAYDLVLLRQAVNSGKSDSETMKKGDINGDGKLDSEDMTYAADYILGKITDFPKIETPAAPVEYEKSYNFPAVNTLKSSGDMTDPYVFMDGSTVDSPADWGRRQSEISCMYEYYMYGKWRDGSDEEVSYKISGNKMTITIKRLSTGKTAKFDAVINLPNKVRHEGGAPVIVGMHTGISEKTAQELGYAVVTIDGGIFSNPVASDNTQHTGAFYELYPYGNSWEEQTGVLMAWSWGCSKILDALYAGAGKELNINPDSSIVTGVSRWGKATAVCGAYEKRFKMCAPSCSGAGGLAIYRYTSQGKTYDFSSKGASSNYTYGQNEPLGSLQSTDERGWFNNRFLEFKDVKQLPMDQHMLASLCADPDRYLFYIGSCVSEDWVNTPSMYLSYLGARKIYDYLGIGDNIAINIHKEGHAVIEEDIKYMVQYFDYHVYGIQPTMDLKQLQTSVFELPKNRDSYYDTFDSKWTH